MTSKTKQQENRAGNPYLEWARIVRRLHSYKDTAKTIRWFKSKKAKEIWGTPGARLRRNALKEILNQEVTL